MITTLLLLPAAAGAVLSPAVATLWGARDMDRIRSGVARSVRLMLLLTITLAGIASAVGPAFVRIVFGPAFADVRTIMIVLAVGLPLVPLGTVSGSVLRAIGTLRWLTIWGITGGIANVVLAFVLVAPFGAIGAAAANSSAQMAVAVPLLVCMRRQIGSVDLKVAGLVRLVLLVTFATAASIVVGDQLPLAAQIVVGSGLFLAVVLAGSGPLRVLSRDDAGWLAELLAGRARGVPASIARYASGQRGG
jgi:O-antigen/teichoic acid export membrane protein